MAQSDTVGSRINKDIPEINLIHISGYHLSQVFRANNVWRFHLKIAHETSCADCLAKFLHEVKNSVTI